MYVLSNKNDYSGSLPAEDINSICKWIGQANIATSLIGHKKTEVEGLITTARAKECIAVELKQEEISSRKITWVDVHYSEDLW